jgi:hypothetical protein
MMRRVIVTFTGWLFVVGATFAAPAIEFTTVRYAYIRGEQAVLERFTSSMAATTARAPHRTCSAPRKRSPT